MSSSCSHQGALQASLCLGEVWAVWVVKATMASQDPCPRHLLAHWEDLAAPAYTHVRAKECDLQ